ncbi:MAG: DUF4365 domain-containing protein [Spirulina sp.]
MMTENTKKEEFSYGYIQLVCSVAGCAAEITGRVMDNEGIDVRITAPGFAKNGVDDVTIKVQVKCTSNLVVNKDGKIKYDLKAKNYNKLVGRKSYSKQILIVVDVPENMNDWLDILNDKTLVRKCGYWIDLKGKPETDNTEKVRIEIPQENLLTPESIKQLILEESEVYLQMLEFLNNKKKLSIKENYET